MKLRRQKFSLDDGLPSKLGSPEHTYKRRRKAAITLKVYSVRIDKGLFSVERDVHTSRVESGM